LFSPRNALGIVGISTAGQSLPGIPTPISTRQKPGIVVALNAMASALDKHLDLAEACRRKGEPDAEIIRKLQAVSRLGRERIRTWLIDETHCGRLAAGTRSGRGRPPKAESAPAPAPASIGAGADGYGFSSGGLPEPASPSIPGIKEFAELFRIPVKIAGDLDLDSWARNLGTDRLQRMGDLEFFLIESLENPWRDRSDGWQKSWVVSVSKSAQALRQRMLEIARMHELAEAAKLPPH